MRSTEIVHRPSLFQEKTSELLESSGLILDGGRPDSEFVTYTSSFAPFAIIFSSTIVHEIHYVLNVLYTFFIPRHRKHSQSEYRKAVVYSSVFHQIFPSGKFNGVTPNLPIVKYPFIHAPITVYIMSIMFNFFTFDNDDVKVDLNHYYNNNNYYYYYYH